MHGYVEQYTLSSFQSFVVKGLMTTLLAPDSIRSNGLPYLPQPGKILVSYHQQRNDKAQPTSAQCHKIRSPIALETVGTRPLASGANMRVSVKHQTVKQVEHVTRYYRAECHEPPVLAEAVDTKRLGDNGREDAK